MFISPVCLVSQSSSLEQLCQVLFDLEIDDIFIVFSLSLRHIVEEFEMRLTAGSKSHNMVRAVDNKFRKAIQEQQVRLSKVCGGGVVRG